MFTPKKFHLFGLLLGLASCNASVSPDAKVKSTDVKAAVTDANWVKHHTEATLPSSPVYVAILAKAGSAPLARISGRFYVVAGCLLFQSEDPDDNADGNYLLPVLPAGSYFSFENGGQVMWPNKRILRLGERAMLSGGTRNRDELRSYPLTQQMLPSCTRRPILIGAALDN